VGKAHKSSYNKYPNICSDIEVYRFGVTLQVFMILANLESSQENQNREQVF
jgi:hypothetical protein